MRARTSAFLSTVTLPRFIPLSRSASEWALPRSAASCVASISTTSIPALAETWAMPAPIMPAPMTPSFLTVWSAAAGRFAPFSSASLLMKSDRIIAEEEGFIRTEVKCRASIFSAVSKGTSAPS